MLPTPLFPPASRPAASHLPLPHTQQVRIHAAHRSDFYLRVKSHPIIEHSSGLCFAPYAPSYEGAGADLAAQGLEPDSGMWQQVNDFGWLRATPSPHWQVLPEGQRAGPPGSIGVPGRSDSSSSDSSGGRGDVEQAVGSQGVSSVPAAGKDSAA